MLVRYRWQGNVRQLKNVLERATILAEGNTVTVDDLPSEIVSSTEVAETLFTVQGDTNLESMERTHVLDVLQKCQGNKSQAARMLGVHRRKLYRLMDRLGLPTK